MSMSTPRGVLKKGEKAQTHALLACWACLLAVAWSNMLTSILLFLGKDSRYLLSLELVGLIVASLFYRLCTSASAVKAKAKARQLLQVLKSGTPWCKLSSSAVQGWCSTLLMLIHQTCLIMTLSDPHSGALLHHLCYQQLLGLRFSMYEAQTQVSVNNLTQSDAAF